MSDSSDSEFSGSDEKRNTVTKIDDNDRNKITENDDSNSNDSFKNDCKKISLKSDEKVTFKDLVSCIETTFMYFHHVFSVHDSDFLLVTYFQGLIDSLCEACAELKWKAPSKIQQEAIPVALQGHDVIGLAETGSGKTGAFALPILQALLENPQRYFALILTPTRELAFQISEQFEALGKTFI